jgi:hypothetical protein
METNGRFFEILQKKQSAKLNSLFGARAVMASVTIRTTGLTTQKVGNTLKKLEFQSKKI